VAPEETLFDFRARTSKGAVSCRPRDGSDTPPALREKKLQKQSRGLQPKKRNVGVRPHQACYGLSSPAGNAGWAFLSTERAGSLTRSRTRPSMPGPSNTKTTVSFARKTFVPPKACQCEPVRCALGEDLGRSLARARQERGNDRHALVNVTVLIRRFGFESVPACPRLRYGHGRRRTAASRARCLGEEVGPASAQVRRRFVRRWPPSPWARVRKSSRGNPAATPRATSSSEMPASSNASMRRTT
jgi:hypothetical protein